MSDQATQSNTDSTANLTTVDTTHIKTYKNAVKRFWQRNKRVKDLLALLDSQRKKIESNL